MKYHFIATLFFVPTLASADFYTKSTDQFGFIGVNISDDFRLSAMCTVSNGEIDKMSGYLSWIPSAGEKLAKAMDFTALDKGVSVCGLRHSKGTGTTIRGAKTGGFDMDIRTYQGAAKIGSDSPSQACKKSFVNLTSICFEYVKLKENKDDKEADAVTACIDVHATDNTPAMSLVLGAGKVSQEVSDAMASQDEALQPVKCANRTY